MKKISLLFILIFAYTVANAEIPKYLNSDAIPPKSVTKKVFNKTLGMDYFKRNYDVLKYNLYMDWSQVLRNADDSGSARYFKGFNEITLKFDSPYTSAIDFDAINLRIDSIYIDGVNSKIAGFKTESELNIDLGSRFNQGDTAVIKIFYAYVSDDNHIEDGGIQTDGMVIVNKGGNVLNKIMYTMSEAEFAREWMPCNDNPNDKAIATISVKTPNDYVCVSNGICVDTIASDSDLTWVWKDNTPIATYLMMATVSKYKTYQDYYKRVSNPNDSIPVLYAYWEADENPPYQAKEAMKPTPELMSLFSKFYGEYPFVKYGMVAVYPFSYGGMEHQTMTTIARNWLSGYREQDIAHELGHQWFGDKITCSSWNDLWINEGGATFSEVLWAEQRLGKDAGMNDKLSKRMDYINRSYFHLAPIRGDMFSYDLTYCKASWFYLMLRYISGEEKFYAGLRHVLDKYAYKSLSTEEFKNAYAEVVPTPLVPYDLFYSQWLDSIWHPIYQFKSMSIVPNGDKYDVGFRITQTQQGDRIPLVFKMPVKIRISSKSVNHDTTITIINDRRIASYTATVDFLPDSLEMDPDNEILCQIEVTDYLGVNEIAPLYNTNLFPNPALSNENATLIINTDKSSLESEIAIYNYMGAKVQDIFSGIISSENLSIPINTENLPVGAYLIEIKNKNKREVIKFNVIK